MSRRNTCVYVVCVCARAHRCEVVYVCACVKESECVRVPRIRI